MELKISKTVHFNVDAYVKNATRKTITEITSVGVQAAKKYAPVDTGYMQANIASIFNGFESKASYSKWVEYGTYKMEPQPFMRPAFQDMLRYIVAIGKKEFSK